MRPAEYWIKHLQLLPHPEGGFYKETYRSNESIQLSDLPSRFTAPRNFSTAIYFLLRSQDRSLFHRIKSDELWHFHSGSVLQIYVLTRKGVNMLELGSDPENGQSLQVTIPANCWFGAKVTDPDTYVLSSCTVAPGFDFNDFELADRQTLLKEFPDLHEIINDLTR